MTGDQKGTLWQIDTSYPGLKQIHQDPPIFTVANFLSSEECDNLMEMSTPFLQRAKTHSGQAGAANAEAGRTSETCFLERDAYDLPSCLLAERASKLTRKPVTHMELPQVGRYERDQRYLSHHDGVDPHTESGKKFIQNGGQRLITTLVYLNDVSQGGHTKFDNLKLEVKPEKGKALIFFPAFMNGDLDRRVLHCGMTAIDTKWVAQVWIRQRERRKGLTSEQQAKNKALNPTIQVVDPGTKKLVGSMLESTNPTRNAEKINMHFGVVKQKLDRMQEGATDSQQVKELQLLLQSTQQSVQDNMFRGGMHNPLLYQKMEVEVQTTDTPPDMTRDRYPLISTKWLSIAEGFQDPPMVGDSISGHYELPSKESYDWATLKHIRAVLRRFTSVLEAFNIPYFLMGRTLMGAFRHGDVVPSERDANICIPVEYHDVLLAPEIKQACLAVNIKVMNGYLPRASDGYYNTFTSYIRNNKLQKPGCKPEHNESFGYFARALDMEHNVFVDVFHLSPVALDGITKYSTGCGTWVHDRSDFFPLKRCKFAGGLYWCPNKTKVVLARMYKELVVPGWDTDKRTWSSNSKPEPKYVHYTATDEVPQIVQDKSGMQHFAHLQK